MRTLFAAFGGATNSSKALLDCIECSPEDRLYLKNNFKSAPAALCDKLASGDYDLVVLFGQRKMLRDQKTSKAKNDDLVTSAISKNAAPTAGKKAATPLLAVRLETVGRNSRVAYHTEVDFPELAKRLAAAGLDPIISKDAGRYLCNNLYFQALKYIDEKPLKSKAIFIHIPKLRQNPDLPKIAAALAASLDEQILRNPDPI